MCTGLEPALIASLVTAAAGSGISAYGAKKTADEQSENAARTANARNAELARLNDVARGGLNDRLAQQSRDIYSKREADIQDLPKRQAEVTDDRTAGLEAAVESAPQAEVPISGSAPEVVKTEVAKRMLDAMQSGKERARSLGTLGGYNDLWVDQGFANTGAGRDIGVTQNKLAGNLALLPFSQQYAEANAYRPPSALGGVMQGAGNFLASAAPTIGAKAGTLRTPKAGVVF
jgi:hypothetical protein